MPDPCEPQSYYDLLGIKPVTIRTNLFHARKSIARMLREAEETR